MIHNIFLDIQINQETGEIFSIGALGCNKGFTPQKDFYSIIKSNNSDSISDEELKYHNVKRSRLQSAKTAGEVVDAFFKKFLFELPKRGHRFIVWSSESFNRFEELVISCGYELPKHYVIEMQEVMDFIDVNSEGGNDLEYYLKNTGFVYNKGLMHNSVYVIDIMSDFYMHVRSSLYEHRGIGDYCVVKAKGSVVFHKPACGYTAKILDSNYEKTSPARIIDGLIPCKFCRNDVEWRNNLFGELKLDKEGKRIQDKIVKGIKIGDAKRQLDIETNEFKSENIMKICAHFGFCYKLGDNTINIKTDRASWIIKHKNNKVDVLLHENWDLRPDKSYKNKKTLNVFDSHESGYHDQKVGLTSLVDVCEYIYKHDKNPYAYKQNKKARLSALFEMIEKAG